MGGTFRITRSERKRSSRNEIFQVVAQSPQLKYEEK